MVPDSDFGDGVVAHGAFVVGTFETLEETVRDGEEGHMFDVWVVLGRICDNVVDIVVSFPPAYAETAEEICNEDSDAGVSLEGMSYAHMSSIMGCEYKLVPEKA